MRELLNIISTISSVFQRVLIVGALLVTASAQKVSDNSMQSYCFSADDPQSILIAKQTKESIELGGAEIFVKSEFRDESGRETVWTYETRSTHTSKELEQAGDNCLHQTVDK